MTFDEFLRAVQIYCSMTAGSISSAGRHPLYNAALGGLVHSPHLYWVGADVRYLWQLTDHEVDRVRRRFGVAWNRPDPMPLVEREERAMRLGLKLIDEGDHDHLQPLDWRAG
jgi:hypothetical protein